MMDSFRDIIRKFAAFENLWIVFLIGLLLLLAWYAVAPFSEFKKLGIPGPAPWPFVGNLPEYGKKPTQMFLVDEAFVEKYGRVCGIYMGRTPVYLISDADLLKQILVKEFSKFVNRPAAAFGSGSAILEKGLAMAQDEDWKRIRATVTPTFSARKLKQFAPLVHQSCDILSKKLEKYAESGEKVDMWRIYGKFTMEVILASAFGIQADVQTNADEPYTPNAEQLFKVTPFSFGSRVDDVCEGGMSFSQERDLEAKLLPRQHHNMRHVVSFLKYITGAKLQSLNISRDILDFLICLYTPVLQFVAGALIQAGSSEGAIAAKFMMNMAEEVMQLRRQTGASQTKDLLELMLRAEITDSEGRQVSKLSDEEVLEQSITLILAGYGTTSNTLAYTTYCLAMNPDVQENLIKEIDDAVGDSETPDYDTVQNLEYLEMVTSEALRLYTPFVRFSRICNESCTLNGVHFKNGVVVAVPAYHLHRDPEYWPDPEKFDPDRFSKEAKQQRHPYCYLPFGTGPRSCIGMRFALMEAKMALVHLLKRFRFQRSADTEVPLQLRGTITIAPKNGIYVKIVPRA